LFYFSFIACATPTIKELTIKQKFVLFYFYFSFIAAVRTALPNYHCFDLFYHQHMSLFEKLFYETV